MLRQNRDWGFLLPAVIIVAIITQVPFLLTLTYSTLRWNLARPDLPVKFSGLANYIHFLKIDDWSQLPEFYSILWQTILIIGTSLFLCTLLGFFLSLLMDNPIPGINIARTLILGPFFVMSTASGVIWKTTILNTTFGWYGLFIRSLGFEPVDLISYYSMAIIIFLFVWQWLPFFVLIILAGLQSIPGHLEDAMKIDGVGFLESTFLVKLPLIGNHMRVAVMLGLVFIVKEFGLILVTTAGGPGTRTYTLPYAVYMQVFNASNVGRAGALAAITVIFTLFIVNWLYRSIKNKGN